MDGQVKRLADRQAGSKTCQQMASCNIVQVLQNTTNKIGGKRWFNYSQQSKQKNPASQTFVCGMNNLPVEMKRNSSQTDGRKKLTGTRKHRHQQWTGRSEEKQTGETPYLARQRAFSTTTATKQAWRKTLSLPSVHTNTVCSVVH